MAKIFLTLACILTWISHSLASNSIPQQPYANTTGSNAQFITYDGTISARVWYPSRCCTDKYFTFQADSPACSAAGKTKGPFKKTKLVVGVNPKLASDDWFFELWHSASDLDSCAIVCFTNDTIRNLDFASSVTACYNGGEPCGSFAFGYLTFVAERVLDLSKVKVQQGQVAGGSGYTVTGDSTSFVKSGNHSYTPGVDVDESCEWTGQGGGLDSQTIGWGGLTWGPNTNFTYSLSFSNSSASMSIMTSVNGSRMELEFSGSRANGESMDIELVTSNAKGPQFRGIDGKALHFSSTTSSVSTMATTTSVGVVPGGTTTSDGYSFSFSSAPTSTSTSKGAGAHGFGSNTLAEGGSFVWSVLSVLLALLG